MGHTSNHRYVGLLLIVASFYVVIVAIVYEWRKRRSMKVYLLNMAMDLHPREMFFMSIQWPTVPLEQEILAIVD